MIQVASKPAAVAVKASPKVYKGAVASRTGRTAVAFAKLGNASTDALMDHAFEMRGTRYRWGGTSRSGVDCSGFTTNVFRSQGISLPRTSRDQSKTGVYIAKSELQPGDLVFFRTARKSYINHVGIYAGDGKFIHSSSAQGQVRVDRLDSGYYSRQLVTARRVVKPKGGKSTRTVAARTEPEVTQKAASSEATEASAEPKAAPVAPKPVTRPGLDEIGK